MTRAAVPHDARRWGMGWRRYVFPALWLLYLLQTVDGVHRHAHGPGAVVGYALVAAFAVVYLVALPLGIAGAGPRFWTLAGLALVLAVALAWFAHADALVCSAYLAVLAASTGRAVGLAAAASVAALAAVLPRVVPGWGGRYDLGGALVVVLVSFGMAGFFMIIRSNIALGTAREQVANLAAENERSRIARDLHDLLGHSLTTITVKAGLARRLAERDPRRAAEEIAAVEQIARRTLDEVRAVVAGFHEVSLARELASARAVLDAAGIEASVPGSVDVVEAALLQPFGWVVREAVTNVVRHSRARTCSIALGPRWIEVVDDGRGTTDAAPGNGLQGLGERLHPVGGTVRAGRTPSGWTVRADADAAPVGAADTLGRVDA